MDNLGLYEQLRTPPPTALKKINGGRISGKTDINPMWRIKALTQAFGPCGIGWRYEITRLWLESGANGESAAFAQINLHFKADGAWSQAIPGIGGSAFIAKEKGGLYTSDECYKMALTDAISVSCKALGVGADVYWESDPTKYGAKPRPEVSLTCRECGDPIQGRKKRDGTAISAAAFAESTGGLCYDCWKEKTAENGT